MRPEVNKPFYNVIHCVYFIQFLYVLSQCVKKHLPRRNDKWNDRGRAKKSQVL